MNARQRRQRLRALARLLKVRLLTGAYPWAAWDVYDPASGEAVVTVQVQALDERGARIAGARRVLAWQAAQAQRRAEWAAVSRALRRPRRGPP